MQTADLITAVKSQGGFDETDAVVLSWINHAYRKMVAVARGRKVEYSLGSTVAGTATYALPSGSLPIYGLEVGGVTYHYLTIDEYRDVVAGTLEAPGTDGRYALDFSAAGVVSVALAPVPTTSGSAITAKIATQPTALDTTVNLTPIVDDDFHEALVDGGIALGKARINSDPGTASYFEGRFTSQVEEYRRRVIARGRTGVQQIRVRHYHYR